MSLNSDEVLLVTNTLLHQAGERLLTDIEGLVLKGAWERLDYDQIAAQNQYATSYISQDIAPKLWKLLSKVLGVKVKKSNVKSVLERYLFDNPLPPISQSQTGVSNQLTPASERLGLLSLPVSGPAQTRSPQFFESIPFYVERPPLEKICVKTLVQPGALLRIKAPRFMGKTALMRQVMTALVHQDYQLSHISFELADSKTHLADPSKLLRWFCFNFCQSLGLPNRLNEYWDEEFFGAKVSCTNYLEQHLLSGISKPIVLALDDVDLLFPHNEVSVDFFGLLRSWYEKAKYHPQWQQLRFMIAHSTDVYVRLHLNQSPFNVGLAVELPEFTQEQAQSYAAYYGIEESTSLLDELMALVGGHPYLLLRAFTHFSLNPDDSVTEVLKNAPTEAGIFGDHLRGLRLDLAEESTVAEAYNQVVSASNPIIIDPSMTYRLQSMGLVKLSGSKVEPRCQLYKIYFGDRLSSQY